MEILQVDHRKAKRSAKGGNSLLMATPASDNSEKESRSICQKCWEGSSNCLEAATDEGLIPAAAASLRGNQIIFLSPYLSAPLSLYLTTQMCYLSHTVNLLANKPF